MSVVHDAATGTSRPASKHMERSSMAPARARDRARSAAYKAGKSGEPMPWDGEDDELLDIYNQGSDERERGDGDGTEPSPRTSSSRSSSSRGRSSGLHFDADDGAGLLLGLVAYALALAYVREGWPGVTRWLGSKFTNQSTSASGGSSSKNDKGLVPAPNRNGTATSPPSSEGSQSRVPGPGYQPNVPPTVPPGWQNPYATGGA